jgi:hypothetical protein
MNTAAIFILVLAVSFAASALRWRSQAKSAQLEAARLRALMQRRFDREPMGVLVDPPRPKPISPIGSAPCCEIGLPTDGVCVLGSDHQA